MCISSIRQIPSDRLASILHSQILKKNHSSLILEFNANEITIVEFIQESVFVNLKPFAEIESEFDV